MPEIQLSEIERFSRSALLALGVNDDDARLIAETIVDAHRTGKGTHGAGRLPIYARKIREGLMVPQTGKTPVALGPSLAMIDARNGFGQVAALTAMRHAIALAGKTGIGLVGVSHSNSFGAAGYLVREAAQSGCVGIAMSNAAPAIAPTGGKKPVFGTNPLAFGVPGEKGAPPIVLDMATTVAARGKVRAAALEKSAIPSGWAIDAEGNPTTDPVKALEGSLLPIGGAKGYGLAMMIDLLAGLLTGSAFGGQAKPLNHPDTPSDCGHILIAVDMSRFLDSQTYETRIARLVAAVRDSGTPGAVKLPGETSATYMEGRAGRVPLSDAAFARLETLAQTLGIARPELVRDGA